MCCAALARCSPSTVALKRCTASAPRGGVGPPSHDSRVFFLCSFVASSWRAGMRRPRILAGSPPLLPCATQYTTAGAAGGARRSSGGEPWPRCGWPGSGSLHLASCVRRSCVHRSRQARARPCNATIHAERTRPTRCPALRRLLWSPPLLIEPPPPSHTHTPVVEHNHRVGVAGQDPRVNPDQMEGAAVRPLTSVRTAQGTGAPGWLFVRCVAGPRRSGG